MTTSTTVAEELVAFARELRYEDIPAEVAEAARLHALDALGCGLAAAGLGLGTEARTVVTGAGGVAAGSVIGKDLKLPAGSAALANGMLCHALDFDDTHPTGATHISAVAVPAALAAAEDTGACGRDAIVAIVAATEVIARLAMVAPAGYHARGFHPTGVCGVFGSSIIGGLLWRLSPREMVSAVGIAASMASGVFAYLEDGTPTKPLHAGLAAHNGLLAARLAGAGLRGPRSAFEARYGVFHAFVGEAVDMKQQLADLGSRWETLRLNYKTVPSCHAMHAVLGATTDLLAQNPFGADDVERIIVRVPQPLADLVLEPIELKRAPRNGYDAKFSLPYSVASVIVRGRQVTLQDYEDDVVHDRDVVAVANRVSHEVRDFDSYPRSLPGSIEVRLRDGTVVSETRDAPDGSDEHPWAADDVLAKYRANAGLALEREDADAVAIAVTDLQTLTDLRSLGELLRRARRTT